MFHWFHFAELPANRLELSPARRFEERGISARDAREARGQRPYGPQGRNSDRTTKCPPSLFEIKVLRDMLLLQLKNEFDNASEPPKNLTN